MSYTTNPNDPDLTRGGDTEKTEQSKKYLVLPDSDLDEKKFIRPVRTTYVHTICGTATTMGLKIAETYARDPKFYGYTYCTGCSKHLPVSEFKWEDGSIVGS